MTQPPDRLPRFEVAPQLRMRAVEALAPDFFQRIFDLEVGDYAWTDESALGDFDFESSYEEIYDRIRAAYAVDVRDVRSPYVVDVLLRLLAAQPGGSEG